MIKNNFAPIETIISVAKKGGMFILVDDEKRENEGDLVISSSDTNSKNINFMAKYGRGLICLALDSLQAKKLNLSLMSPVNQSRNNTAFTISIEAKKGITTGISAKDRARTIKIASKRNVKKNEIVSPGHVFPIIAKDGGVLVRAGHTEASVDISRLAKKNNSAVICEIMNEDGTMARMPDLINYGQLHGLKIGTIADLIAYRLRNDRIISRTLDTKLNSAFGGEFRMIVYTNEVAYAEHIALVKGEIFGDLPTPVRMHALNVLNDILGEQSTSKAGELQTAMKMISELDHGVVVLIREPHPTALSDQIGRNLGESPIAQPAADPEYILRDYGVGAQILLDLGVRDMVLLSNTQHTIVGLEGYGLRIVEQKPIRLESVNWDGI